MAVDYFLRIEGIEGESQDAKHKGEIDVLAWSWGASNAGTAAAGGAAGAGKVSVQDLQVTMPLSKASPKLFQACAAGQHLKSARLGGVRAGGKQAEFLTVTLTDVVVSSYQTAGSEGGEDLPMDQVSLNAARVAIEYKAQKADGTVDVPVVAGWDLKANTKV